MKYTSRIKSILVSKNIKNFCYAHDEIIIKEHFFIYFSL